MPGAVGRNAGHAEEEAVSGLCRHADVRRAEVADRRAVQRMLELYQHDLSDLWDQDLDARGEYGYALDRFWQGTEGHHVFVAQVNGHYAGFALVDQAVKIGPAGHWMDQFFVLKKYRRGGVGTLIASQVFSELRGAGEVGQMPGNLPAQAFWRRAIAGCTRGRWEEHVLLSGPWQGVVQCFEAAA